MTIGVAEKKRELVIIFLENKIIIIFEDKHVTLRNCVMLTQEMTSVYKKCLQFVEPLSL